jgi:putative transposase
MPDYRRNYVAGGTYFFTVVTHCRRTMLTDQFARKCLHEAIAEIQVSWSFDIVAIVLLPDHFHTVWTLPKDDGDYSVRLRRIKEQFTRRYLEQGGTEWPQSISREVHGQRGVWQKRFWEHTIQDEHDWKRCVDFVHWNPKKHRLVSQIKDWPWSSFHRFVEDGEYEQNWGGQDPAPGFDTPEWNG